MNALINHHPAVMFEIMAEDQSSLTTFYQAVFEWNIETGSNGFGFIHFQALQRPLLGGIGQAQPDVPGFRKGITFYLEVKDMSGTISRLLANGGAVVVPPTPLDGYTFANFTDPEGNLLGLIEPFAA